MSEPLFPHASFPALQAELFDVPTPQRLAVPAPSQHRPRFLMLYGSLRERSYSRLLSFEAARLLEAMGAEVRLFDPSGLPLPDDAPDSHPKVQELRGLAAWSEGMVWCSPERHGAMTGIMKAQIDWIPLARSLRGRGRGPRWAWLGRRQGVRRPRARARNDEQRRMLPSQAQPAGPGRFAEPCGVAGSLRVSTHASPAPGLAPQLAPARATPSAAQTPSGAVRPTQGKTLAVMQVCGGSQSFNAVNQMRLLGRWMRMLTIPNQSSVAKAFAEFDDDGRMKPSAFYDRVVDVMEELFKFTLLTRDLGPYLLDRYSERKESAEALSRRVNQRAI